MLQISIGLREPKLNLGLVLLLTNPRWSTLWNGCDSRLTLGKKGSTVDRWSVEKAATMMLKEVQLARVSSTSKTASSAMDHETQ